MFRKVSAPSTLLILTDEIQENERVSLTNFVESTPHFVEILVMNTAKGGAVPGKGRQKEMKDAQGAVVYSRSDPQSWNWLAANDKITVHYITLDQSDVEIIAEKISNSIFYKEDDELSQEEWEDMGGLLLIPTLVLTLLWFRKGFVVQWCFILIAILGACTPEGSHADWWYDKDFQGQALYDQQDYLTAAETYLSEQHQAVAYYKRWGL